MSAILAGLASAIPQILGSGMSIAGQIQGQNWSDQMQQRQNNFAHDESLLARQHDIDMFNMQNEYNTPQAMLDRLLSTGMNPSTALSMMSGQGNVGSLANSGVQAAPASAPSSSGEGMSMAGNILGGIPRSIMDNLNELEDWKSKQTINYFLPKQQEEAINKTRAEVDKLLAAKSVDEATANQINQLTPELVGVKREEQKQIEQSIKESGKRVEKIDKDMQFIDEQMSMISVQKVTELYKQKLLSAQAYQAIMAGNESQSNIELNFEKRNMLQKEIYFQDIKNRWAELGIIDSLSGHAQLINYLHVMTNNSGAQLNDMMKFIKLATTGKVADAIKFFYQDLKLTLDANGIQSNRDTAGMVQDNGQVLDTDSYQKK